MVKQKTGKSTWNYTQRFNTVDNFPYNKIKLQCARLIGKQKLIHINNQKINSNESILNVKTHTIHICTWKIAQGTKPSEPNNEKERKRKVSFKSKICS